MLLSLPGDLKIITSTSEDHLKMHQGLKWRREEPSWTELGKLKEQAGTSQVAVMNRAIKIKDEKDDKEGRGEAATCCYPIGFLLISV